MGVSPTKVGAFRRMTCEFLSTRVKNHVVFTANNLFSLVALYLQAPTCLQ